MKALGRIFLIVYALDAVLGLVASFVWDLETASNGVSCVVLIFAVVVLILACLKRVRPQVVFLVLSGYYLLMSAFGMLLGFALVSKLGPQAAQQPELMTLKSLGEQFGWYWPVHWVLMGVWLLVSAYGLLNLGKVAGPEVAAPAEG
jgi:hypothetical protein